MGLRKVLFDKGGTTLVPIEEDGQAKPAVMGVRWTNPDTFETIRVVGGKRTGPKNEVLMEVPPTLDTSAFAIEDLPPPKVKKELKEMEAPRRAESDGEIVTEPGPGALAGLRVLDLTGHRAQLCARLLADMGADVIKVEQPAGDDARRIGPFLDDLPHRDRSLFFWFYNLNKRSLTLDLKHSRGADILRQLVRSADVVIESFAPGTMDQLGLGWDILHRENPALVLCSIAPFGQTGPYRDYVADDTVLTALGGMLYVNGFPNHAPVRPLGLQAYHSSAYFGAIAVMLALLARDETAEGQWIDLSMQEATAAAVEHVAGGYFERNEAEPRRGTLHWSRFFRVGKCRDGYIMHCTLGDWTSLIEWVKSDGKAADLDDPNYQQPMYRYLMAEHVFEVLDDWVKDYPRDELLERAQLLRQPYATVRPPEALFDDDQLIERGYFVEVEHPELGRKFRYPGAPYLFNGTPWRVSRRPPLMGEHTGEILRDELAMAPEAIAVLAAEGVI